MGPAQNPANPSFIIGLHHSIIQPQLAAMRVHIIQGGGYSAAYVFNATHNGGVVDISIADFVQGFSNGTVQPVKQQLVAAQSFEAILEKMSMGVNKPGKNILIPAIDHLGTFIFLEDRSGRFDGSNPA